MDKSIVSPFFDSRCRSQPVSVRDLSVLFNTIQYSTFNYTILYSTPGAISHSHSPSIVSPVR